MNVNRDIEDERQIKPPESLGWGFHHVKHNVYRDVIQPVLRWIKQIQKYVVFHSSGGIIHPQSQIQ